MIFSIKFVHVTLSLIDLNGEVSVDNIDIIKSQDKEITVNNAWIEKRMEVRRLLNWQTNYQVADANCGCLFSYVIRRFFKKTYLILSSKRCFEAFQN
jgi:hypothetical protein